MTNDLEKNGLKTEASSLFKPKILSAIDHIKIKRNVLITTPSTF